MTSFSAPLALLLALVLPAQAQVQQALPVHVGGRTLAAPDGSRVFGWPGVYIEARFRGAAVRVRFDAPDDHLRLLIDGRERRVFRAPGKIDVTIAGLAPGEHRVRLEKLTESQAGSTRFIAFEAPGGTALRPESRKRQIEFIGDSFTVGYGNTAPSAECTAQQVHDLTDTSRAFGPLVARALDADYRIHAFSGFGMVRNYNGGSPGQSLPAIYPRALPADPAPATPDPAWKPETIVINLGTNDFSTALDPGEAWPDAAALRAAYRDRYAAFVGELAERQPQARFLLMGSDRFYPEIEAVASRLKQRLPGGVRSVRFSGLALDGCHGHPSLADHRLLAKLVDEALAAN